MMRILNMVQQTDTTWPEDIPRDNCTGDAVIQVIGWYMLVRVVRVGTYERYIAVQVQETVRFDPFCLYRTVEDLPQ